MRAWYRGAMQGALKRFGMNAAAAIFLVLLAPFLVAVIDGFTTVLRQGGGWLKTGVWIPESTMDGLHRFGFARPAVDWAVPQRVIDWFLNWPRWIGMPVIGLAYAAILLTFLIVSATYLERWWKRTVEIKRTRR